jgi:hypothetical protein
VVPVTAELVLGAKYEALFPESLNFRVARNDGGTVETLSQVSRNAGVYTAQWTPPGEGVFLLTAAYPETGGPSTTVQLTVDKTPPTFTVTVPPADAGVATDGGAAYGDPSLANAWRRDQVVPVEIRTDEPNLDQGSLMVALRGTDGGVVSGIPVTPFAQGESCDAGFCGVAQVRLWETSFNAFRGTMQIAVQGKDKAGNTGDGAGSVNVTRWKWVFDASAGGTFTIKTPPAVGAQGVIYFGTVAGSTGRVFAIQPWGGKQWDVDTGAVVSGPAIGIADAGTENVYVGVNPGGKAALVALNSGSGSEVVRCELANGQIASNLVLTQTPVETVAGAVNVSVDPVTTQGVLQTVRPRGAATQCSTTEPVAISQVSSDGLGPLVVKDQQVFFADDTFQVTSYRLGTNTVQSGWPVQTNLLVNGLALAGDAVVGGNAGLARTQGRLFSIPTQGVSTPPASPTWSYTTTSNIRVFQPIVGSGNIVFFGTDNLSGAAGLAAVSLGGNTLKASHSGAGVFRGAPVLGQGGVLYAAASEGSGSVGAWSAESVTNAWVLVGSTGAASASPALDCARDGAGTARAEQVGVLYVPAGGKLYAFVVDSRGLDPSAPWPKFQHDARNTGNPATPVSSCP